MHWFLHQRSCGITRAASVQDVRCVKWDAAHTTYMSTRFARSVWASVHTRPDFCQFKGRIWWEFSPIGPSVRQSPWITSVISFLQGWVIRERRRQRGTDSRAVLVWTREIKAWKKAEMGGSRFYLYTVWIIKEPSVDVELGDQWSDIIAVETEKLGGDWKIWCFVDLNV